MRYVDNLVLAFFRATRYIAGGDVRSLDRAAAVLWNTELQQSESSVMWHWDELVTGNCVDAARFGFTPALVMRAALQYSVWFYRARNSIPICRTVTHHQFETMCSCEFRTFELYAVVSITTGNRNIVTSLDQHLPISQTAAEISSSF